MNDKDRSVNIRMWGVGIHAPLGKPPIRPTATHGKRRFDSSPVHHMDAMKICQSYGFQSALQEFFPEPSEENKE